MKYECGAAEILSGLSVAWKWAKESARLGGADVLRDGSVSKWRGCGISSRKISQLLVWAQGRKTNLQKRDSNGDGEKLVKPRQRVFWFVWMENRRRVDASNL